MTQSAHYCIGGADPANPCSSTTANAKGNNALFEGYGSCFWLLSSAVSGPSQNLQWTRGSNSPEDYAFFNQAGRQAPLKRFRGNLCSTSMYGLISDGSVFPNDATIPAQGLTPVTNPYLSLPADIVIHNAPRPQLPDLLYKPTQFGANPTCLTAIDVNGRWPNAASCATTLIDRFTTSFNWAEVNFGSIWLRPFWYVVLNSAVTDQLAGGLGFVGGGNWAQAPAAFFDLVKEGIFIGFSQSQDASNPYASAFGPTLNTANDCNDQVCVSVKTALPCLMQILQPETLAYHLRWPVLRGRQHLPEHRPIPSLPSRRRRRILRLLQAHRPTRHGERDDRAKYRDWLEAAQRLLLPTQFCVSPERF